MILGIVLAVMTLAALTAVLLPLIARRGPAVQRLDYDLQIYRDQLRELEADVERGVVPAEQAATARTEIERHMLTAAKTAEEDGGPAARRPKIRPLSRLPVAIAVGLALPAGAVALYLGLGTPGLPGQPFAERPLASSMMAGGGDESLNELIVNLARELQAQPDNLDGWLLLARSYMVTGRYAESVGAFRRAQTIAGPDATIASELGEALVLAAGGTVTPEAFELFDAVLAVMPGDPAARFYAGMFEAQRGEPGAALDIWLALAADTPADAPWFGQLRAAIEEAATGAGVALAEIPAAPPAGAPGPGPSAEDVAAAAEMTADEQAAMIEIMVGRLAERLAETPDDREGWLRLAQSYEVLERYAESVEAYRRALALAPDDGETLAAMGETMVMAAGGRVTPEAYAIFAELAQLEPDHPVAPFYMGLGHAQDGEPAAALEVWQALADRSPAEAPWMAQLRLLAQTVAEAERARARHVAGATRHRARDGSTRGSEP